MSTLKATLTTNQARWLEAIRRGPDHWIKMPVSTGQSLVRRGYAEQMIGTDFFRGSDAERGVA